MGVIGSGLDALEEFVDKCTSMGGIPQIRTGYGGVQFNDKVIVACYGRGKQLSGGEIVDIPKALIEKCASTTGDYRYIKEWIAELKKGAMATAPMY